jgi:hypothetical protein
MENKINQSTLDFSCGAGSASVNLYTGGLLFERADITMGANSFAVGVSHIYDGQANVPAENNPLTGKRWKLNIQQNIAQNGNGYLYTDADSYTHEFEQYHQYTE